MQTTSHILMIRPVNFTFNAQTAVNNAFQVAGNDQDVQRKALEEFDEFVLKLRNRGIDVLVVDDTPEPHTPDSIFPNNWVSFHDDGSLVLYPMYAENRRQERKPEVIEKIKGKFSIKRIIDLSKFEEENKYLEGTGSMVLDRDKNIAYACLSPRTDNELFRKFCDELHFQPVPFNAVDQNGKAIYHTNVMMCVADRFIVICLDCIPDNSERDVVTGTILKSGKEIIEISVDQVNHFAGNMLQVNNYERKKFLVMSSQAYASLNDEQLKKLSVNNEIIHSSLDTIETNGGGSARCMMAEVHLQDK
jgi:hypothetical protein